MRPAVHKISNWAQSTTGGTIAEAQGTGTITDTRYVIEGEVWNPNIAAGGSVNFSFSASGPA